MKNIARFMSLVAAVASVVLSSSCGGGGGGTGGTVPPPDAGGNTLSGTAAIGVPVASGTVTLKDSSGVTSTTTTDANGNYSFKINTKFPAMLRVQPNTEGAVPLYSAALAFGTANTTPLTTLQVFEAVGRTDPSLFFSQGDFSRITRPSLDQSKLTITSNFATQFAQNGIDAAVNDLITTPMTANGTGVDAVLDATNIAILGNGVSVSNSNGSCFSGGYGPANAMTFAIDGMTPGNLLAFFRVPPLVPSGTMDDQYPGSVTLSN